mgnify:CR=1 FL=1
MPTTKRPKKYFSRYKNPLIEFPNLLESQIKSYRWLIEVGIKEIFKEFKRLKSSQTAFRNGLGLGLAVVYGIVKAHNATIKVISQVNKGSKFEIKFPLYKN